MPSLHHQDFFNGSGFYYSSCPQVQFSVGLSSPLVPVSPVCDLLLLREPIQDLLLLREPIQQVLCVLSQSLENRDVFCPLVFPLLQNSPSCEVGVKDGVEMSSSSSPSVFPSPWECVWLSVRLQGVISGPKSVQAWCTTLNAEWIMEKHEGWYGSVHAALPSLC